MKEQKVSERIQIPTRIQMLLYHHDPSKFIILEERDSFGDFLKPQKGQENGRLEIIKKDVSIIKNLHPSFWRIEIF